MCFFIDPACHILLPLRNVVVRIARISVRLGVGIDGTASVLPPDLTHTQPPVLYAVVALSEIVLTAYHRIEEILTGESVTVDHGHCTLTMLYLGVGVATETDAVVIEPVDLCQQLCYLIGY